MIDRSDGDGSTDEGLTSHTYRTDDPPLSPPKTKTEDPLYRDNEKQFAWVCQDGWTYSTTVNLKDFKVNSHDQRAPWQLCFEGIDTVANVTWNGRALPGPPPRSMFVRYTYEVPRDYLSADGRNTLSVSIEPGECVCVYVLCALIDLID